MAYIKFALLIIVLVATCQGETKKDDIPNKKKLDAKARLFKTLFENYNPEIIPDSANLKFGVALIKTQLNEEDSSLDSNLWLRMVWNDPRLKWEEEEFNGVGVLRVSPSNVWIPDIRLYNSADTRHGDLDSRCDKTTKVLIYPNGEVLWVPPCRFSSICPHTLRQFPMEPQTCLLKFGSWTYDGHTLGMSLYNDKNFMDLSDFWDVTPWKVIDVLAIRNEKYYPCCPEPYTDVSFNVTVQRKKNLPGSNLLEPTDSAILEKYKGK